MDNLKYVVLSYYIVSFSTAIISFYLSAKILFRKIHFPKTFLLPPIMIFYFIFVLLFSTASLIYFPYYFIFWRPDFVIYNAKLLFLLGITQFVLTTVNPLLELILCLERCLTVIFPIKYDKKRHYIFLFVTGSGVIFVTVYVYQLMIPYYPKTSETNCRFFSCFLQSTSLLYVKNICVFGSLATSIVFAFLLKFRLKTTNKNIRRINRAVLIIILLTTFNELMPSILAQLFYNITNQNLSIFIGPFGTTVSVITITISSAIYYASFKRIVFHTSPTVHVI